MNKVEFKIANMECKSCEDVIKKKLESLAGVKDVNIDLQTKKVILQHDNPNLCQDDVTCAVEDMGYKVQVI
ncbi:MAG: heavy metal-associated domain-containing protein [Syntrophus sp. (in: bacteria)]